MRESEEEEGNIWDLPRLENSINSSEFSAPTPGSRGGSLIRI